MAHFNLKLTVVAFFFFLTSTLTVQATSYIGNEIEYRQTDSMKYEVDFIFYRHCSSGRLTNQAFVSRVMCSTSGTSKDLSPSVVSISQIKTACDSAGSQCGSSPNSFASGPGIERIVFRSEVDFDASAYSAFITKGCGNIRFEVIECCRATTKVTTNSGENFYNYAELQLYGTSGNSTPRLTINPIEYVCCNQPAYLNIGAIDTIDGDSLSYNISVAQKGFGSSITYSGKYSNNQPINVYYPGTLKYPYVNPTANPPIGMYVDPSTGEMIFTPTQCDEHTIYAVQVVEWRKDTATGRMAKIGAVTRDIELKAKQCPSSYVPIISGNFKSTVCEETRLCFTVSATDQTKKPPPPMPTPEPDSVVMYWNHGIPGATLTAQKDTFREKESMLFCWQPKKGDARPWPYTFVVGATDNNCKELGITSRSFQVFVTPKVEAFSIAVDSIGCGTYAVTNALKSQPSNTQVSITASQISGNATGYQFLSNKSTSSSNFNDTIEFLGNGSFVVSYSLNNSNNCPTTVLDTITVQGLPDLVMAKDTELCASSNNIVLDSFIATTYRGGTWSIPNDTNLLVNGKEVNALLAVQPGTSKKLNIHYEITSSSTCSAKGEFDMTINPLPLVRLRDSIFCQSKGQVALVNEKIVINPSGASINLGKQEWNCVDCGNYDPSKLLQDTLNGTAGPKQLFVLNINEDSMPLGSKTVDSILISLRFTDAFGCTNADTSKIVVHEGLPRINFDGFPDLCYDEGVVNLRVLSNVNPSNGTWTAIWDSGYAQPSGILPGLNGDTLDTRKTANPGERGDSTYLLRYSVSKAYCLSYRDTTITIRGLPKPEILRTQLQVNSITEPFAFCTTGADITLKTNYPGGTFSTSSKGSLVGNVFKPSATTELNKNITLTYEFVDVYGCYGKDDVIVRVSPLATLTLPKDTSYTWKAKNNAIDVKASYTNTTGVTWIPLNGGSVDKATADSTTYRFTAEKDSVTKKFLYAQTTEIGLACPFVDATMTILVYPSPTTSIIMDYNLSTKQLSLLPGSPYLKNLKWTVLDSVQTGMNPSYDMSNAKDSIVLIKLYAENDLGDSGYSYNKLNVLNGSIQNVVKTLSFYPNPVEAGFTIETESNIANSLVAIIDQTGKTVRQFELKGNYVDCKDLVAGFYTVTITTESGAYVGRFVKQP